MSAYYILQNSLMVDIRDIVFDFISYFSATWIFDLDTA
jgi:hypothetical protein